MTTEKKPLTRTSAGLRGLPHSGGLPVLRGDQSGKCEPHLQVDYIRDDGKPKTYVVQRVNTFVFKNPRAGDGQHRSGDGAHSRRVPKKRSLHSTILQIARHMCSMRAAFGGCSTTYRHTYNSTENLRIIRNAGEAFGEFQMLLSDFDAARLYETIPDFHNTKKRYEKLIATRRRTPSGGLRKRRRNTTGCSRCAGRRAAYGAVRGGGTAPARDAQRHEDQQRALRQRYDEALVVIDLDT